MPDCNVNIGSCHTLLLSPKFHTSNFPLVPLLGEVRATLPHSSSRPEKESCTIIIIVPLSVAVRLSDLLLQPKPQEGKPPPERPAGGSRRSVGRWGELASEREMMTTGTSVSADGSSPSVCSCDMSAATGQSGGPPPPQPPQSG